MKGLLVRHQIDFARTHDIAKLLQVVKPAEPGIADALVEAKWLTPFGVHAAIQATFRNNCPEMRSEPWHSLEE